MKPTSVLASAVALIALSGCNKQPSEGANAPVKLEQIKPPPGGDWTQVVNATPGGGVMMGNPNAKVHLIEIGSLTCPHCREFDETSVTPLVNTYVKSGQVSYEFRNYIRDSFDLAAVLISHCNGPKSFFPLARALYKDQPNWVSRIQAAAPDKLQSLQTLPENQIALQAAQIAGLQEWAAMRGVPAAKSAQCLADAKAIDRAVEVSGAITQQWPDFQGTPSFVINDKLAEIKAGSPAWDQLKAALNKALG